MTRDPLSPPPEDTPLAAGTDASEQALHWFSRMQLGALNGEALRDYQRWRAADPEHDRQMRLLEVVWRMADAIPVEQVRADLRGGALRPGGGRQGPARRGRRRAWLGAGAVCAVAVLAVWLPRTGWLHGDNGVVETFTTAHGERTAHTLADASQVWLNGDTQLRVRYGDGRRHVELLRGEAAFSVTADARRPFIVDAGIGTVQVTGTRFIVRREDGADRRASASERFEVAVESGSVAVSAGPWWQRRQLALQAGQGVVGDTERGLQAIRTIDLPSRTAWLRGRLVFRDAALVEVVAELNRYLLQPLEITDSRIAAIRIAASFSLDEPQAVLDALPRFAPVRVQHQPDGRVFIVAR